MRHLSAPSVLVIEILRGTSGIDRRQRRSHLHNDVGMHNGHIVVSGHEYPGGVAEVFSQRAEQIRVLGVPQPEFRECDRSAAATLQLSGYPLVQVRVDDERRLVRHTSRRRGEFLDRLPPA